MTFPTSFFPLGRSDNRSSYSRPSWLQMEDRWVKVGVTSLETSRYDYTWHQSPIECEGKGIPVVSMIERWAEGDIYYKDPEDFLSVKTRSST